MMFLMSRHHTNEGRIRATERTEVMRRAGLLDSTETPYVVAPTYCCKYHMTIMWSSHDLASLTEQVYCEEGKVTR